jgi:hypothetical protein
VRDQVSHLLEATGNITILYVSVFRFLIRTKENLIKNELEDAKHFSK